jgi:hypothetical protein
MLAILGLPSISIGGLAAYVARARRRAMRWNARHLCGWCAVPLEVEHAFVDGHAVCPGCAGGARWRLATSTLAALATSGLLGVTLLAPALRWSAAGIPVGATYLAFAAGVTVAPVAVGLAALRRMQSRNRAALAAAPTARVSTSAFGVDPARIQNG